MRFRRLVLWVVGIAGVVGGFALYLSPSDDAPVALPSIPVAGAGRTIDTGTAVVSAASPFGVASASSQPVSAKPPFIPGHSLATTDDLHAWLVAVRSSRDAAARSHATHILANCPLASDRPLAMPGFGLSEYLKARNGGQDTPPEVLQSLEQQRMALQLACGKTTVGVESLVDKDRKAGLSLYSRYRLAKSRKDQAALREVRLIILQSPTDEPLAFDLWLDDLWQTPLGKQTSYVYFEQAYVEDGIYRSFVQEPPNSLRSAMRCVVERKCRPELVVRPERKAEIDAFIWTVVDGIRARRETLFL
jgi:hypothetical protein